MFLQNGLVQITIEKLSKGMVNFIHATKISQFLIRQYASCSLFLFLNKRFYMHNGSRMS